MFSYIQWILWGNYWAGFKDSSSFQPSIRVKINREKLNTYNKKRNKVIITAASKLKSVSIFLTTKILGQPQNKGVWWNGKSLKLALVSASTIHFPRVLSEDVKEQRNCLDTCKPEKYYVTPSRVWKKPLKPLSATNRSIFEVTTFWELIKTILRYYR